jgi:hypothetical protein
VLVEMASRLMHSYTTTTMTYLREQKASQTKCVISAELVNVGESFSVSILISHWTLDVDIRGISVATSVQNTVIVTTVNLLDVLVY